MRARLAWVALGVAIAVVFVDFAQSGARVGTPPHIIRLTVAGVAYCIAIAMLCAGRSPDRRLLGLCLALGLVARAPLVLNPPGTSDDGHRYVWDARLQRAGLNPYLVRPDDPAFDQYHTPQTRLMNNRDVPSPYPPGAQYFFRAVTWLDESVIAIKAALVLAEAATVVALWVWLRGRSIDPAWTLVYAWHPIVIFETASAGHLDALGTMLLVAAVAALSRGRPLAGVLAAAGSVSIKFLPIVLAPALFRHVGWRHAAAGTVFLAVLYLPFVEEWRIPPGSLGVFVDRFRFNQLAFDGVERVTGPRIAAAAAVVAGLLTAVLVRPSARTGGVARWAWPMAVSLLLSPVVYPWYLIWLVPFAIGQAALPLLVWSLAVGSTYGVWELARNGQRWAVPPSVLAWEYGAMAAVALIVLVSRRRKIKEPTTNA